MKKFLNSEFELDLSSYDISTQEENHWFNDSFFSKYTLPFEIALTDELDQAFGFISFYNSMSAETYFNGHYFENGKKWEAVLEVEGEEDNRLTISIRFGMEEFPSFTKKLSELPLDKFAVPDIYDHAAEVISKTWPEVNYNFPQLHTDKIDTDDDVWFAFEKIINNYKDGVFPRNSFDLETDTTYNRNIIQPVVYALHILESGFRDAGFTFEGEIKEDPFFKKLCVYADGTYYTTYEQESLNVLMMSEEAEPTIMLPTGIAGVRYYKRVVIPHLGRYRITGTIKLYYFRQNQNQGSAFIIHYRNQRLAMGSYGGFLVNSKTFNVDVVFDTLTDLEENYITIEALQNFSVEQVIFDLAINPIRLHDTSGEAIPTVINENNVNLPKAVPDMTFGDFYKILKNWFNLDIDIRDSAVHVNFVQNEINREEVMDYSEYEAKKPRRQFNKGISFLMQFQEVESKDYTFSPVFQNIKGVTYSSYVKDEKTNDITINALPLPLLERGGVQTAHAFANDASKLFAVLYDGLNSGLNLTKDPSEINLPSAHERHSRRWFDFRINSQEVVWTFFAQHENILDLTRKSRILAYQSNHIIKNIQKNELRDNEYSIEITTATALK